MALQLADALKVFAQIAPTKLQPLAKTPIVFSLPLVTGLQTVIRQVVPDQTILGVRTVDIEDHLNGIHEEAGRLHFNQQWTIPLSWPEREVNAPWVSHQTSF
jgi:hypothetical protein